MSLIVTVIRLSNLNLANPVVAFIGQSRVPFTDKHRNLGHQFMSQTGPLRRVGRPKPVPSQASSLRLRSSKLKRFWKEWNLVAEADKVRILCLCCRMVFTDA